MLFTNCQNQSCSFNHEKNMKIENCIIKIMGISHTKSWHKDNSNHRQYKLFLSNYIKKPAIIGGGREGQCRECRWAHGYISDIIFQQYVGIPQSWVLESTLFVCCNLHASIYSTDYSHKFRLSWKDAQDSL